MCFFVTPMRTIVYGTVTEQPTRGKTIYNLCILIATDTFVWREFSCFGFYFSLVANFSCLGHSIENKTFSFSFLAFEKLY